MSITVFTDLDDTLFQTRQKAYSRAGSGALTSAASDRTGAPLSFHAPDQLALLGLLADAALVPVTGRNAEALGRVDSPRFADYRITSHGALIYTPAGAPLGPWYRQVAEEATRLSATMQALAADLAQRLAPEASGLRARVILDAGLPVYVSVKADQAFGPALRDAVVSLAGPLGEAWTVHANGRNLAVLPPFASKAAAVARVMEIKRVEDPHVVFLGLGDSLSDLAYLKLCDFAVVPRNSQIQQDWP